MPIIKVARHNHGYVIIQNKALEDTRLSWKARGLLAYLLTRPADWSVNSHHLSAQSVEGRRAVLSGLKELRETGYAELVNTQRGREWIIYESPHSAKTASCGLGYLTKEVKGTDSKVPLKGEEEAMFELTGYFSPDECSAYGANWRLRYRECPEKFKRLLLDLDHSRRCPGKKRTQSWAAIANIRWHQLKPETKR